MITIKNVSKSFGNKQVLFNIDLTLKKGKVYGIVGRNGSGKSTLFKCIAGLEKYIGQIESPFEVLKNHVGLLETNPIFMSRITGWEYLKLLCVARKIKLDNFEEQNIFDLPLGEYADTYSTGMKKKLALMGILLQKNDIYILDEPFNGVDIQSNILIMELIQELKKKNKTVFLSSHIFSTLSNICDEIFLIEGGRIKKSVTQEEFLVLENDLIKDIKKELVQKLKIE